MTDSPPGRFYFWGLRALHLGPGMPAAVHAHHAVQVCIPLSGTVRLRTGSCARWRKYDGAVIASDQPHESDVAVPLLASLWLDPDTTEARRLVEVRGAPLASIEPSKLAAIVPRLLEGWHECHSSERAAALMDEVVQILARHTIIRARRSTSGWHVCWRSRLRRRDDECRWQPLRLRSRSLRADWPISSRPRSAFPRGGICFGCVYVKHCGRWPTV